MGLIDFNKLTKLLLTYQANRDIASVTDNPIWSGLYNVVNSFGTELGEYLNNKRQQKLAKKEAQVRTKRFYEETKSPIKELSQKSINFNTDLTQHSIKPLSHLSLDVPGLDWTTLSPDVTFNPSSTEVTSALKLGTNTITDNTTAKTNNSSSGNFTSTAISSAVGSVAGAGVGYGINALGNKLGTTKTKGGQFATNLTSTIGSNVAGSVFSGMASNLGNGSNIFSGIGSNIASSFAGNAGNLANLGMAAGNIALDVFDPVKKSKAEVAINTGVGLGLGIAAASIPVVGWAGAAAALAANAIGHMTGNRLDTFTADNNLLASAGNSYRSTNDIINKAAKDSGVKFSGYNNGAYKRAWAQQQDAKFQQKGLGDIMKNTTNRDLSTSIASDSLAYEQSKQGGYNQVSIGREGMSIKKERQKEPNYQEAYNYITDRFPITKNINFILYNDNTFRPDGYGDLEYWNAEYDTLPYYNREKPDYLKGKSVIIYNNNVDYEDLALDALSHGLREQDPIYQKLISKLSQNKVFRRLAEEDHIGNNIEEFKLMSDSEKDKFFKDFWNNEEESNSAIDGLVRALLVKPKERIMRKYGYRDEDFLLMYALPEWQAIQSYINNRNIDQFKKGGSVIKIDRFENKSSYIHITNPGSYIDIPDDIEQFRKGGSINVIPDGSLHAHKHNMNTEGITTKGIPVVDNDGVQQAEIEREELIIRISITERLENLNKIYQNPESSKFDKDSVAFKAGKLLVDEILNNTNDNTNILI